MSTDALGSLQCIRTACTDPGARLDFYSSGCPKSLCGVLPQIPESGEVEPLSRH